MTCNVKNRKKACTSLYAEFRDFSVKPCKFNGRWIARKGAAGRVFQLREISKSTMIDSNTTQNCLKGKEKERQKQNDTVLVAWKTHH